MVHMCSWLLNHGLTRDWFEVIIVVTSQEMCYRNDLCHSSEMFASVFNHI